MGGDVGLESGVARMECRVWSSKFKVQSRVVYRIQYFSALDIVVNAVLSPVTLNFEL